MSDPPPRIVGPARRRSHEHPNSSPRFGAPFRRPPVAASRVTVFMRDIAQSSALDPSTTEAEAPRLNRRQAAKVRTRQKVLDAARALFAERGYEPATIRDIAKGA